MDGLSAQSVGREFVRQYYTMMHQAPKFLHRFYSHDSSFLHDGMTNSNHTTTTATDNTTNNSTSQEQLPAIGQMDINGCIDSLKFRDCHARIRQVDSQLSVAGSVVIQVVGELSNGGVPLRRFMQTFVLVPQSPKKYYVHNDIFRYQDEVFSEVVENNVDAAAYGAAEETQQQADHTSVEVDKGQEFVDLGYQGDDESPNGSNNEAVVSETEAEQQQPQQQENQQHQPLLQQQENQQQLPLLQQQDQPQPLQQQQPHDQPKQQQKQIKMQQEQQQAQQPQQQQIKQQLQQAAQQLEADKSERPATTASTVAEEKLSWAAMARQGLASKAVIAKQPAANVSVAKQPAANISVAKPAANVSIAKQQALTVSVVKQAAVTEVVSKQQQEQKQPPSQQWGDCEDNEGGEEEWEDVKWSRRSDTEEDSSKLMQQHPDNQQMFIGNIPHNMTEPELLTFFAKFGTVLSIWINKKNIMGVPNIGFVTFESAEVVKKVLSQRPLFNGTQRVNVEAKKSTDAPFNQASGRTRTNNNQTRGRFTTQRVSFKTTNNLNNTRFSNNNNTTTNSSRFNGNNNTATNTTNTLRTNNNNTTSTTSTTNNTNANSNNTLIRANNKADAVKNSVRWWGGWGDLGTF